MKKYFLAITTIVMLASCKQNASNRSADSTALSDSCSEKCRKWDSLMLAINTANKRNYEANKQLADSLNNSSAYLKLRQDLLPFLRESVDKEAYQFRSEDIDTVSAKFYIKNFQQDWPVQEAMGGDYTNNCWLSDTTIMALAALVLEQRFDGVRVYMANYGENILDDRRSQPYRYTTVFWGTTLNQATGYHDDTYYSLNDDNLGYQTSVFNYSSLCPNICSGFQHNVSEEIWTEGWNDWKKAGKPTTNRPGSKKPRAL